MWEQDGYTWKHLHVFLCVCTWKCIWVCLLKHNDCSVSHIWAHGKLYFCTGCGFTPVNSQQCMGVCQSVHLCVCVCVGAHVFLRLYLCVRLGYHYSLRTLVYNSVLHVWCFSRSVLTVGDVQSSWGWFISPPALFPSHHTLSCVTLYNSLTCNTQPSFLHLAD